MFVFVRFSSIYGAFHCKQTSNAGGFCVHVVSQLVARFKPREDVVRLARSRSHSTSSAFISRCKDVAGLSRLVDSSTSLWDPLHSLFYYLCQDTVISLLLLSSFQFTQAVWTIEGKTATLCPCFHLVCSYSPLDVFG